MSKIAGTAKPVKRTKERSDRRLSGWAPSFFVALLLCCGLRAAEVAGAEHNAAPKLVLSLEEMIERALAKSPELGESRSEAAVALSELREVQGAYYPRIESMAVVGPVPDAELPIIRDNRIYDPSPDVSPSTIGIFGRLDVTVTQPLYTFGRLSNSRVAADLAVKAAGFETRKKENEIALRVSRLYYALVLARGGAEAAKEADGFFEETARIVKRLLELNSPNATRSDLYRIEAYRANVLRSQAEAEKGERVAYFGLKALLGLPADMEFATRDQHLNMEIRPEELEDLPGYIQKALAGRPEIHQLKAALEARQHQVEAERSSRYPTVFFALEGSLAGAPGRDTLDNRYIPDEFNHAYAGVAAGIKWDLDFGISAAKVDKSRAEYRKLLYTRNTAEMNIPIQVAKAYQEALEWETSAEAYHKAAVASRRWVVAALGDFNMGLGSVDDLLNAIEKYGENQSSFVEALFNYHVSLAELKFAVGEIRRQGDGE